MLAGLVADLARQSPDLAAVVGPAGEVLTYGDLANVRDTPDLGAGVDPIAIHRAEGAGLAIALVRADSEGRPVLLLNPDLPMAEARAKAAELGFKWFWGKESRPEPLSTDGPVPAVTAVARTGSKVLLLTSGTSGPPKVAIHDWASLGKGLSKAEHGGGQWLLTYHLSQFAGIQVFLQALAAMGTLVIPRSRSPEDLAATIEEQGVSYVSGTPTFWTRLLIAVSAERLRRLPLRHITLGGEVVPGPLLERLKALWPNARLHQIYASTELGVLIRVNDGLPGFPGAMLNSASDRLQIREGELWAKPAGAMYGYVGQPLDPGTWTPTGDLVEVQGDRVLFRGRRSDIINVGGAKAVPGQIEAFLARLPGVVAARVFGKPSSITGQVVAAEIVLERGVAPGDAEPAIRRECASHLPPHAVPRLLAFVEEIELGPASKALRRG